MPSVEINHIGKAFKYYPTRLARLLEWLCPQKIRHKQRWVLQDIHFSADAGEAIGIVGVNGAGKSTLLKIITGTTQPTTGNVKMYGHVAALLELGMGFHGEFSGRQNAYMAGQLLGLSVQEITNLMPEIETFAEIGNYIDAPVRVYSSGMQMRLAFAVATAKRPDVLIVDEALSVGDAYFQHKSFERIRQLRRDGTTLLIVSHDRYSIQTLCDRAILLNGGRIEKIGDPVLVMDYYNAMLADRELATVRQEKMDSGVVQTISGTGEASITSTTILDEDGHDREVFEIGSNATLIVKIRINQNIERLILGFMIKDRLGQAIYGINTHRLYQPVTDLKAGEEVTYRFNLKMNLGHGSYSLSFSLSRLDSHLDKNFEWRDNCRLFQVINLREPDAVGCAWLKPELHIERNMPTHPNTF